MAVCVNAMSIFGIGRVGELVPIGIVSPDITEIFVFFVTGDKVCTIQIFAECVPFEWDSGVKFPWFVRGGSTCSVEVFNGPLSDLIHKRDHLFVSCILFHV